MSAAFALFGIGKDGGKSALRRLVMGWRLSRCRRRSVGRAGEVRRCFRRRGRLEERTARSEAASW